MRLGSAGQALARARVCCVGCVCASVRQHVAQSSERSVRDVVADRSVGRRVLKTRPHVQLGGASGWWVWRTMMGCQGGYTGPSGHHTDSGSRWYDLCGLVGRLGGTLRTLRSLCLSFTVGLGVSAVSKDSEDYGSLTGMRCAVVSRRSGIVLTTTTTFCRHARGAAQPLRPPRVPGR